MQAELWTWASCPYCVAAIELLETRGVEYTNHVMDGKNAELSEIKQRYGHRTVPIILVDGEFIGGFDQLRALDARGSLGAS